MISAGIHVVMAVQPFPKKPIVLLIGLFAEIGVAEGYDLRF